MTTPNLVALDDVRPVRVQTTRSGRRYIESGRYQMMEMYGGVIVTSLHRDGAGRFVRSAGDYFAHAIAAADAAEFNALCRAVLQDA